MSLNITANSKSDLTSREWLSQQKDDEGNPLAVFPGRGRFSGKALAALAEAAAQGMTFSDPVKPEPKRKPVQQKTVKAPETAAEKRARLTAELAALDTETEPETVTVRDVVVEKREPVTLPVLRASEDGKESFGVVGYDHCFRPGCFQTVVACKCKQGPKPPANLVPITA